METARPILGYLAILVRLRENAAHKSFGRAAVFRAIQSCRCNAFHFLSRLMTALCLRKCAFHRKLFPLPVVLALHPRLKLLPGAFPGSNHFAECLFGRGGAPFLKNYSSLYRSQMQNAIFSKGFYRCVYQL